MLGYRLIVTPAENGKGDARVKEVAASDDIATVSDVVTMLQPNTKYTVTVAAVNKFGTGPSHQTVLTTAPANQSKY